jgi:hypothetical protein
MLIVKKVYTYRQSVGSSMSAMVISGFKGEIFAAALAQLAGMQLDNHMGFVVSHYGKETAFHWSNYALTECSRLVAGDCHPDVPVLGLLWEKSPVTGK